MAIQGRLILECSRTALVPTLKLFAFSSRELIETLTLVKKMSPFWTIRMLSFLSIFFIVIPGVLDSTIKPSTCLVFVFLAQIIKMSAMLALPIHLFEPFKRKPPSTGVAVVVSEEASDPYSGSVNAQAPILSKLHKPGK